MYDMDSQEAGQEEEGRHVGKLGPYKHAIDEVNDSSLNVRLVRQSTTTLTSHHGVTPKAYPRMLGLVLPKASSSQKSQSSSGIGETPLSNHSRGMHTPMANAALELGLPIPSYLYRAAYTPGLGIPNHQSFLCATSVIPSPGLSGLMSELLPHSCGDAAAEIRRSTLFPHAGTNLSMIDASIMNGLSPSLLVDQQHLPRPGMTRLDEIVASGLVAGALSRRFPNALPSLQDASEIMRSLHLPSSCLPLTRTHVDSSGSIMAEGFELSLQQVGDGTQHVGGTEFFPMVLHRALAELELVAGGTDIAAFLSHGRSFQIKDQARFEEKVLPCFFPRMKGFPSFQRQLNLYKFRRLGGAGLDRRSYSHELFVRHQPELARRMRRTRVKRCMRPLGSDDSA